MNLFEIAGNLIGIPFKEHGRDRKGVDCFGLILLFYKELGFKIDDYQYKPDWFKGDYNFFLENYHKYAERIPENQMLMPGDAILFKDFNNCPTHIGIYLGNGKFIHCLKKVGVVINKLNEEPFKSRIEGRFRVKGYKDTFLEEETQPHINLEAQGVI